MSYQTPKVDWVAADNPGAGDFNRIEGNAAWLKNRANILIPTNGSSFTVNLPDGVTSATVTVVVQVLLQVGSVGDNPHGNVRLKIGSTASNIISSSGGSVYGWLAITATVTSTFTVSVVVENTGDTSTTVSVAPIAQIYFG